MRIGGSVTFQHFFEDFVLPFPEEKVRNANTPWNARRRDTTD